MGRWAIAGMILALASATRVPGLLLIIPVAMLYLYGPRADREPAPSRGLWPRYRIGPEAAWLLLAPLGLVAFSVYLPTYLKNAYALSPADASNRMAGFVLVAVLLRPLGGWLSDRVSPGSVLAVAFAVVAAISWASL